MLSKKTFLNLLPIILILLLASILRLLWLDKIPIGIGGDELTYVFNAKAIFLTGSDISGTWSPLSALIFHYPAYTTPQAELPYFLLTPVVGLLQFSLLNARITFAFLSVLTVIFIYLIAKEFFGSRVGVIAGLVAAINPWLIYIGRTDYEQNSATLFFLIGLYVLLKAKGRRIILSLLFFFLAFYSYIGTKLIFFPFILIACVFSYVAINKKKYLKEYLIVSLVSLFLVLSFAFIVSHGQSRLGEILNPNDPAIANQVDAIRKASIQTPLTNIFENKYTIFARIVITKFFTSFNADYLFISGDRFFSIYRNGLFYILDAFFLLMGLVAAYVNKRKAFWFLLAMTALATVPQILHTTDLENMTYHIALVFPFLIILIAVGIWEIVQLVKNKYYFYITSAVIILLYLLLVLNFLNIYFFQNTLQGNFDFPVRLLAKYVSLSSQNKQSVIIYSPSAHDIFKKYLFYTNNYNKNTVSLVRSLYKTNNFSFENIQFLGCNNTIDPTKTKELIVYDFNCGALKKDYKRLVIPRLSDGGQSYDIYNDKICSNFSLKRYPANLSISDFSIESQTMQQFCETFITNP